MCKFGQMMRNIQRAAMTRRSNKKVVLTELEKEIDKLSKIIEDNKADKYSIIQAHRDRYKMLKNKMTKLCHQRGKEKRRTLLNNIKKDGKALHKPLSDKENPQVGAIKQGSKLITNKKEIAEVIANQVSKTYVESTVNGRGEEQNVEEMGEEIKESIIDNFETNEEEIGRAIKEMKNSGTKDPMGLQPHS